MPVPMFAHPWQQRRPNCQDERTLARIAKSPSTQGPRAEDAFAQVEWIPTFAAQESLSARAFLSCQHEAPIKRIRLVAAQWYTKELAQSLRLAEVTALSLRGCQIGPQGMADLAQSPYMHSLQELDLSQCRLGPDGLATLLKAPWFGQLKTLKIAANQLTPECVSHLVQSGKNWQSLDVSDNAIKEAGWALLDDRLPLQNLKLDNVGLTGTPLVNNKTCQTLSVAFNALGDAATATMVKGFESVTALSLRGNQLSHNAIAGLTENAATVEELDLAVNPLVDVGLAKILAPGAFPRLRRLDCTNTLVTTAGVGVVFERLCQLEKVSLAWNAIDPQGFSHHFPIHFTGCPTLSVSPLRKSFPTMPLGRAA